MSHLHISMPTDVSHIIKVLEDNGHEAYAVGGCVRDAIMGRIPHDWDITTSAKPSQVKALFRRTIDTGIQHGTVTIMMGSTGYEVTTYRIDGNYSDGRHPEQVTFTKNLVEDLKRRDFTINAMAYNDRAGVVDEFDGTGDLEHKIIRCVGVATERFTEDALRILRAIRFSAQLDFIIAGDTADAIKALAANLKKISRERIQTELDKLITSNHPDRIKLVQAYGLAQYIFDNAKVISNSFSDNSPTIFQNISDVMEALPTDHYMRWTAMTIYEDEPQSVLKGLKFDNKTIDICKRLHAVSKEHMPQTKPELRRMIVRFGKELFDEYVFTFVTVLNDKGLYTLSSKKEIDIARSLYDEIIADKDCISMKDMAIKGADLIAMGMAPGKAIGNILDKLFQKVLDDPSINTYEQLKACINKLDNLPSII
ncbi:MAG: CCA tRNA nucleotidyltransferase [Lachnospiraceae bacterium]|nr:CCA tRNA nucleotidyltransferase [Lachnospiraceae bacterium]